MDAKKWLIALEYKIPRNTNQGHLHIRRINLNHVPARLIELEKFIELVEFRVQYNFWKLYDIACSNTRADSDAFLGVLRHGLAADLGIQSQFSIFV